MNTILFIFQFIFKQGIRILNFVELIRGLMICPWM